MTARDEHRDPTDAEIDFDLVLEGFNPRDRYPEYGYDDLRRAYRAGWEAAL